MMIRLSIADIQCQCAHACMFEEDEEGVITASCYCHNGFELADDERSCEPVEEDEEAGIIQVIFSVPYFKNLENFSEI